jgi:hypothetical protein
VRKFYKTCATKNQRERARQEEAKTMQQMQTTTQASRSCAEIVAENQSRGRGGRPRGHRRPHDVGVEVTMAMRRYAAWRP